MTRDTTRKVNAAIGWYPIHDTDRPGVQQTARKRLKASLQLIADDCCDENNEGDFEEIALLIKYLDDGKKLKPLTL
ncbi:hypothetical protein FMF70_00355 [Salmonella enterica]|uniref:Uncharacterized protein n=1 Tax=Salmonella enterica I TaxID=59201 RepID=A0A5U3ERQ9_SALET|nr:hypothetical protein [Salmonella enterica subsp. enterica]EBP3999735.1 hypothetical protein [Salmonella enterica subsp. enterica]ECJ0319924.1 hypothetical protein [Salmonella enterica]EIT2254814.1 hypothetical protein [Salmonella enterica]EJD7999823.1 hypothetical protein [Salmonella enterica]